MQHAVQAREDEDGTSGRDDVGGADEPSEPQGADIEGADRSMDPEAMTLDDVIDAEAGRPDLPDETSDGLDDMEEEIRRQAEDLPLDTLEHDAEKSARVFGRHHALSY